jgi:chorismate mutase / prephenate dehydrogenase
MTDPSLDALRDRIRQLDEEILARAAERLRLAREVGARKREQALSTVDYSQERAVLERARRTAEGHGLDASLAEQLIAGLIRASVSVQDQDRVRHAALGAGQRAVLVGGAGRMGRWLGRFLEDQGYTTGALDPAAPAEENAWAEAALMDAELVVSAAPPVATAALYAAWTAAPPRGVIVDIASIKSPLIAPIRALREAGARVASIHPMFGPSVTLLRDCDIVICDTGDVDATARIEALFEPTTARLVHLPLDDHDRVMADVLSLAHATAIAFAVALPADELPVRSTTYQALESLSARLVRESADVYYEIQTRNPYSGDALERLRASVERVIGTIAARDADGFRALLAEGRAHAPDR